MSLGALPLASRLNCSIPLCRTEAIHIELLEPLAQSILTYWNYDKLKEQIMLLQDVGVSPQAKNTIQYVF